MSDAICTFCGRGDDALRAVEDAAGTTHVVHDVCWEAFRAWLAGRSMSVAVRKKLTVRRCLRCGVTIYGKRRKCPLCARKGR